MPSSKASKSETVKVVAASTVGRLYFLDLATGRILTSNPEDLGNRVMYWTDRGDPPRENTVNRAPMDPAPGTHKEPEIVFNHLMEGIGLSLDLANNRMFLTDLGVIRLQRQS